MMAAMEEKNTIWIKQEKMDDTPDDPDFMSVEDPLGNSCPTDFIKQEPEVILNVEDTKNVPQGSSVGSVGESRVASGDDSCGSRVGQPVTRLWPRRPSYRQYHCAVYRCATNGHKMPGVTCHYFPKDERLRREWLARCGRTSEVNVIRERICSVHFRPEDYRRDLRNELLGLPPRKKLIPTAVPTLNLPSREEDVCTKSVEDPLENSCPELEPGVILKVDDTVNIFLQDPLKFEEHSLHEKKDVELKQDADDSEQKVQVYPSNVNIKEEMGNGVNQEFPEDSLRSEDPGLHIKQDPELILDVDGPEHNEVASRSYASTSTWLLQSNERCDFPVEENVSQGVSHNQLEIGSEKSTHFIMFHEGAEEKKEESLSAPRLKCSLRENKYQTFFCSFCLQSFSSKYSLMMHVFVHMDGVEPPKSVCKSCGEVFPSYVSLKNHLEISEPEQDSSADKEETFHSIGKSFTNLRNLKSHALIDTDSRTHKCDICGKSFTQLSHLKQHALIHTGRIPHKCDTCGKSFTHLFNLKSHLLIHTGTCPHKCDICEKSFNVLSHLKTHLLIHTGVRPHKCDTCGISFTHLCSLKSHALIHTGIKPHKCDTCGKSFTRLSNLKCHVLIHTGIKLHKCDNCGKSFTQLRYLRQHALIHSGKKCHKCDICGKSFTHLSNLKGHALIHTGTIPHKCDTCGKSFTRLSTLKSHVLIHTGTKPHKCDICGKSFTLLSHLRQHALIHTGTTAHKCDTCGISFTRLSTLKRHSLLHTGT